ncbi:hypothetical protein Purlil1_1585 [Purpureocillium lilacinum]|uniref:Uncharacterized protein n=1 Tax=Purpureocillium lilacinum TaxID=33203 RepID=A0ABR0CCF6_PURLI|nr:hypothetical protein Purlil1_1585 [Purpureocillium lilacinum]
MLPSDVASEAVMQQLAAKGRDLYQALEEAVAQRGETWVALPEIAPYYNTAIDNPDMPTVDDPVRLILDESGSPTEDYVLLQIHNVGEDWKKNGPPYLNYVHAQGKAILCMSNFGDQDLLRGRPGHMFWSDLMAVGCSRVVTSHGGDLKSLEKIWRITIKNPLTRAVVNHAVVRTKFSLDGLQNSLEFAAGSDHFFALLATDNGKGVARMLAAFPEMFGRKTIDRVVIYPQKGSPHICWSLKEAAIKPSEPAPEISAPSRKQRRHMKKASLSSRASC